MLNFVKLPVVVSALFLCGYIPMVSGQSNLDRKLAIALEDSLPSLVMAQDYRAASSTALELASAHSRLGETTAACAALQQSLEHYRKAVAKESGITEPAVSHIEDSSDGMAAVRAKFGCTRS